MLRILHLTLEKKWFNQIVEGTKVEEYREIKPYWIKRLVGKIFDEIYFRNGYAKNCPFMRVKWEGMYKKNGEFAIKLGEILEIKNYETKFSST